jgi:Co/Zn/Cd efflux system component
MNDFLNKLFGFNYINLVAWIIAGLCLLGVSGFFGYQAFERGKEQPVDTATYILCLIAILLLGLFCLLLQIYCALVVEQLNKQSRTKSDDLPY